MAIFDRLSRAARALFSSPEERVPGFGDAPRVGPNPGLGVQAPPARDVAESPYVDKWPVIFGPLLTPGRVAACMRRAERGYMRSQCDLLSEMRETVPHLQSELQKREGAVSALPVVVKPRPHVGKRDRKRAERWADFVREEITRVEDLQGAVLHLSSGDYFGRAAMEKVWIRDKDGLHVDALRPLFAKRLAYTGEGWDLHVYDEGGNRAVPALSRFPGFNLRKTWPDSFVIHEPATLAGELPTRQGLGRVLLHVAMFYRWTAKDVMQFLELYAKPIRWGEYTKENDENEIEVLKEAVQVVGGNTSVVLPVGCKLNLVSPTHAKSPHSDTFALWCAEMSKVVAGGTLQTSEARGSSGTRAQAEVHQAGFEGLVAASAARIGSTLTRDLAEPLVRLNSDRETADLYAPIVHLSTDKAEDLSKKAERVWSFVDRGGQVAEDDVRDLLLGLPKPEEGAPVLIPIDVVRAGARAPAGGGEANTPGSDSAPGTADGGETDPSKKAKKDAPVDPEGDDDGGAGSAAGSDDDDGEGEDGGGD